MMKRMQITRISNYSSEEGFSMYRDREYELEAYYDSPTDHDVDAMAVMYLYFGKLDPSDSAARPEPVPGG